jgi:hypothetical protein
MEEASLEVEVVWEGTEAEAEAMVEEVHPEEVVRVEEVDTEAETVKVKGEEMQDPGPCREERAETEAEEEMDSQTWPVRTERRAQV